MNESFIFRGFRGPSKGEPCHAPFSDGPKLAETQRCGLAAQNVDVQCKIIAGKVCVVNCTNMPKIVDVQCRMHQRPNTKKKKQNPATTQDPNPLQLLESPPAPERGGQGFASAFSASKGRGPLLLSSRAFKGSMRVLPGPQKYVEH